jgi:porin
MMRLVLLFIVSLLSALSTAGAQQRSTGHSTADPLAAIKTDKGLISLTKAAPDTTPVSDYRGDFWNRSTALGDLFGERQNLYDMGVTLDAEMTQVVQGVASGGPADSPDTRYFGLLDYGMTLDTAKLGLWSGGLLVANAQTSWGNSLIGRSGSGNLSPTNMLALYPIPGEDTSVLMEYYVVQALPGNISVVAGRINAVNFLDKNRFANDPHNQFLNVSMNNDPLFGSFVSFSTYGVLFNIPLSKHFNLQPAVYDANAQPGDYGGTDGFFDEVGVGSQVEVTWTLGQHLGGALRPVFIYVTKDTVDISNPRLPLDIISGQPLPRKNNNYMFHVNFEQYLWKPAAAASRSKGVRTADYDFQARGVGVFFRFGIAPEDRNPINMYVSGGVGGRGVIASRPYDRFGLGMYWLKTSGDLGDLASNLLRDEVGFETFYNVALTPWFTLSGNLQWIKTAIKANDNPVVLGMRLNMLF